jgi:hypothetical protein
MRLFEGGLLAALLACAAVAAPASAATTVLSGDTMSGAGITCAPQGDGVRVCHGADGGSPASDLRLKSFDGQPLEVYVILPPGTGSHYPLVIQSHGWGGSAGGWPGKLGDYSGPTSDAWAKAGYAVLQLTARGFNDSCGSTQSRLVAPSACASGYIRLDDTRYEVRDAQYAAGLLADADLVDPQRVGATGPSYGGGVSLALATLRDRMMLPDGSLVTWTSPGGKPMRIAAAAPVIPWSDLVASLLPNGRTLDDQITSPTADLSPIGVDKQSFVAGLYGLGNLSGQYAPPGVNPEADLTTWFALINAGEPYDSNPQAQSIVTTIARYHSSYYLLNGAYGTPKEAPSPLLIANGFTDDLFPVDEAIRYVNLEHSLYPGNPVATFDWDGGHQRGQNKTADNTLLATRIQGFFDHYVLGSGVQPSLGATALTQTCPASAPSGGPYEASSWSALHPGQVTYSNFNAHSISSSAGDPSISKTIDPIAGGGACATTSATDQGAGVATYRLPAATGNGYTLLGAAKLQVLLTGVTGSDPYIAERLWDVDPHSNTQTLVSRGVYRLDPANPNGTVTFQLHPGGWHFAAGHIPKIELLGQDTPYVRAANTPFTINVAGLVAYLPVHETPGSPGTPAVVTRPGRTIQIPVSAGCPQRPSARITTEAGGRHGIVLKGTAAESRCRHPSATQRRLGRITRVVVSIARGVGHGRCRFVQANGRLSRPRRCSALVTLKAGGTGRWQYRLHLRHPLPAGRYGVIAQSFDGFRHRALTRATLRIRNR